MCQPGKYLYCIIPCREERTFDGVTPIGAAAGSVHTVPGERLSVVVSDATAREYEGTRAHLLAHERVQERVMQEYTLLPVRFGTVAEPSSSVSSIQRLLQRRAQEFDGHLADMEGKVELGLKALWRDERLVFQEVLADNEDIRRLRDSLEGKPPWATRYERIRLGEMVKKALERRRSAEAAALLAPLRAIALRTVENPTIADRMIANAAFLVGKQDEQRFDRAVSELEKEWGPRVSFKYVGPVPPYNFVNIIVNWQEV